MNSHQGESVLGGSHPASPNLVPPVRGFRSGGGGQRRDDPQDRSSPVGTPAVPYPRAEPPHPRRVFLVGAGRSGTTLLQSLLFAHPDVASFPETHYLSKAVPRPRAGSLRSRLGIPVPRARAALDDLEIFGLLRERPLRHRGPFTVRGYLRLLATTLDAAAREAGASGWVEKTPDHLFYLDEIEKHIEGVMVVHLVRSGDGVVASLRDAVRRTPDVFPFSDDCDGLLENWRRAIHRSAEYIGRSGHLFVSYERLVRSPSPVLERLCSALGFSASSREIDAMLSGYAAKSREVGVYVAPTAGGRTLLSAQWQDGTVRPIAGPDRGKFRRLLDGAEQERVLRAVEAEKGLMQRFPFL